MQIQDWLLEVDIEATKEYYNHWVDNSCNCLYCQNYKQAIEGFPVSVVKFLTSLGIEPNKIVGEIMEFGSHKEGTRLYSGCYAIKGKILQGPDGNTAMRWKELNLVEIDPFTFAFSENLDLIEQDFPLPAIKLDFEAHLPWVLSEKSEE